jgi:hypothetical protein
MTEKPLIDTAEQKRLNDARETGVPWKKWGPYLSERQWGTVREDYSSDGNAWDFFPHDHARSRAYRWGEDGLGGISDEKQRLCFALALWNGRDPIIKERLFGLTNGEGNHGEDVKEYYFYLDATPTHSYLKYLYKYPQDLFPYDDLVRTNKQRSRDEPEYELLDTGVFDGDRYFDVCVEYAKAGSEDILIRVTAANRGPKDAALHLLPTLWFRNTWSWEPGSPRPELRKVKGPKGTSVVAAHHHELGDYFLYAKGEIPLLFTENETNLHRLFQQENRTPYVKDGINDFFIKAERTAVNPRQTGTKMAAHFSLNVKAGGEACVRLRLTRQAPAGRTDPFGTKFEEVFEVRRAESDEFYQGIIPANTPDDTKNVFRQALSGMIWSKQYYFFDLHQWLKEHDADPFSPGSRPVRNRAWFHMVNDDIISMPDKWEYPWYAAWDLAFHSFVQALVDPDFAKDQLGLMLSERYLHPNGQMPAYEWNFGDVNPPVHAFITLVLYLIDKARTGQGDVGFLKNSFNKLLLNFTWWVNRKDRNGKNVFEGGFLGMDNIGVFDRSSALPTGGFIEQADGTAWMALYAQNMFEISLELAVHDAQYENMALKFAEHFLWISCAMDHLGDNHDEMWDEADGFFYDVLRHPDGRAEKLRIRSMVGLLPFCAVTIIEPEIRNKFPHLREKLLKRLARMQHLQAANRTIGRHGFQDRAILTLIGEDKLRRILARLLDEAEFLGEFGIRSLSRAHAQEPFVCRVNKDEFRVGYVPGDSTSGLFGGNSNWRGPIWMPVNMLILRALRQYYLYYGDSFKVECPVGSGRMLDLYEVGEEITRRLTRIFLRDKEGRRPVHGSARKFQEDPHWRDLLLFYEFFHGDSGAGLGASHQTGWTGLVARFIQVSGMVDGKTYLKEGRMAVSKKG